MSILRFPYTYGSLKRLRQIAMTLAKHGFSHLLAQLHLAEHVPGFSRLKVALMEPGRENVDLSTAERLALVFQELGATAIKFGQLLATRPDLIPPDFVKAVAVLTKSVTPLPTVEIRQVIETSLGAPTEEIFSSFDDQAVASGSIGQVHFATLKDGEAVVVKVKRPGTDEQVRKDLDLLSILAGLAEKYLPDLEVLRPKMVVEEFSRSIERELDFVGEAAYTANFPKDFTVSPELVVPQVYWDYVSRDTLVLERMEGIRLSDIKALDQAGIDRKKLAVTIGRCFMRQFFETGFFHGDPHPGNIFVHGADRFALMDYGQMGHLSDELRRQLAITLLALAQGDTDFIVDIYAEIGVFTERSNLRQFKGELATLVSRYYGIPVDRLNMGEAFQEALAIARDNSILLPRDFVILGKSFVTVMSVIRGLDPSFRVDTIVRPFTAKIFANLLAPASLVKRFGTYLYRVFSLLRRGPEDMRDLLEKLKSGRVRIIFHHEGLDEITGQLERASNRLTLAIITAAITIGSAIVLAAGPEAFGKHALPLLGDSIPITVLVASLGFAVAVFMGLYLAWAIIRSKRL